MGRQFPENDFFSISGVDTSFLNVAIHFAVLHVGLITTPQTHKINVHMRVCVLVRDLPEASIIYYKHTLYHYFPFASME